MSIEPRATLAEVLRDVRLEEARRLLRESSCSMKEIAFRVGFRHPSQFTRVFTADNGMSPSQYRVRAVVATPVDAAVIPVAYIITIPSST